MNRPDFTRDALGLALVRVGAVLVATALILSFWASPDRRTSLPWFLVDLVGVALVLVVTGPLLPAARARIKPGLLLWLFLSTTFLSLMTALLTSRWPAYKLAWLNRVYAAIPSIRSWSWAQAGLSPNQTGGVLALCTAFSAAVAVWPGMRKRHRVPAIVLTITGVAGVFMTGSRAALAGLVVALLLLLVARTSRWLWLWAPVLVITLVGMFASGTLQRAVTFFVHDETVDTKLVARLDIWTSAVNGIQDHFFSGIGLGVFNKIMPFRYPYQTVGLSYPVSQAHNLVLDTALSIGVPGAIGFVVLLVGMLLLAVRGSRRRNAPQVLCLGILASIAVYLVFGITDSIGLSIPTSFIVWLWACALAIFSSPEDESATAAASKA